MYKKLALPRSPCFHSTQVKHGSSTGVPLPAFSRPVQAKPPCMCVFLYFYKNRVPSYTSLYPDPSVSASQETETSVSLVHSTECVRTRISARYRVWKVLLISHL